MKRTPKRLIVPIFLPQAGCPHRCVFCSQESLTGYGSRPSPEEAASELEGHLGPGTKDATIAFYGGSFTALEHSEREAYLSIAARFVETGRASGIRVSTRPDSVDGDMGVWLAGMHVSEVELGVQSMDDRVLAACGRGHKRSDTVSAVGALKEAGISVGVQIMLGLPGDSHEGFIRTVRDVIDLRPDFARVFPTVVVEGAPLARMWREGRYDPPELDEAASLCADAAELFDAAGIPVIKFGLQATARLDETYLAGAYHPAFGHIVESERAFRRMRDALAGADPRPGTGFVVNPRELSVYKGISGANLARLREAFGGMAVHVGQDPEVEPGGLRLVGAQTG